MRALFYILLIRFKNRIKSLVKSPGALILIVILLALLLLPVLTGDHGSVDERTDYRSMEEVYAIMTVFYCIAFVMGSYSGLSKGASLYSMPDINLVFTSPISAKKVLFYGLIQQMGTSLFVGFFILYQYGWMHNTYGIFMGGLALILLGYAATVFCGQLTAMVLYSLTTGDERKSNGAKAAFLAVSGLAALYLLISVYPERGRWLETAVSVLNGFPMKLFPVGGWAQSAIVGIMAHNWMNLAFGLGALLLYTAILVGFMAKGDVDFYEDVLRSAEITYSAIAASKQGRFDGAMVQNVKVGKTGIGKGFGADSFYYKHRLESRRAKLFLLDRTSVIFILIIIAFAFFMRSAGIIPAFIFATYMQIFSVALGRWIRELMLPYIYMVPEPSFIKLLHCLRESLLRIVADAVVLFIPIAFMLKLSPAETMVCIGARISYGLLFTSGNIVVQRFFSGLTLKLLSLFFYFVTMVLLILPGIGVVALLMFLNIQILPANLQIFSALILCNLLMSLAAVFLCRNMLEYSEVNYPG
jgi:type IV secretory pathway TrbD component